MALAAGGASLALGAGTAAAAAGTPCTSADITWTALSPTSSTVTLTDGADCWVSLNSYDTDGSTWATSGTQVADGHDSFELSPTAASKTLSAPFTKSTTTCFGQTDLYGGNQLFDGTDGALPSYPGTVTPLNLLAEWNGSIAGCTPGSTSTPPPVVVTTPPPTTGTTPTVPTPTVSLTTVAPQFPTVAASCSSGNTVSTFVVPSSPVGVEYWVNGSGPVAGGTVKTVPAGSSSTITAVNTPGYTLGSSSTTTTLVASAPIPCPLAVAPPKPQGVLGETVTTPSKPVTVLPVTLAKPPAATLPFTGLPTTEVALFGFAFIAAGGTLLVATRRRQAQRGAN